MRFMDLFRRKFKLEEEIKSVSFSEAEEILNKELIKGKEKIEGARKEVNDKVADFVSNLEERIAILNLIDLKERKEEEKLKTITLQNLNEYKIQLNRLVEDINKINRNSEIDLYFKKIEKAGDFFIKHSRKKLDKATILIGNELGQTEEIIQSFYKEIKKIIDENNGVISKVKDIERLSDLKKSFDNMKIIKNKVDSEINNLNEKKEKLKNKKIEKEKELELFRESAVFKEWVGNKEKVKKDFEMLNSQVNELKNSIDLKALLKQFHEVDKKRELVRNYRENFLNALENDKDLELIEMIGNEDKKIIAGEIKKISSRNSELKELSKNYRVNKEEKEFEKLVRKINSEIDETSGKIQVESRKLERFNDKEKVLSGEIKGLAGKILSGEFVIGD